MKPEMIRELGFWSICFLLVAGAIVGGFLGKDEVTGACLAALGFWSICSLR